MTEGEFAFRMREIKDEMDTEYGHVVADDLMCEVLRDLDYGEGIGIYEGMDRWYA